MSTVGCSINITMIRIDGPTYRYSGERICDEVIYIDDHHYDEKTGRFPVQDLLDNNPGEHVLVFDHLGHDDQLRDRPHVTLPVFLAAETREFIEQKIQPIWHEKTHCFNFMINKPRSGRKKFLALIDQMKLTNFLHTLCWQASPYPSIPTTDYRRGDELVLPQGFKNQKFFNAMVYHQILKHRVFEPTCVSMITEPCYHEREIMITEKTLMAMYGGTIPIWAGGWRLPDAMRDLGFDVFDDLVDHSYSTLDDPDQRMRQAVLLNQRLLTDLTWARYCVMSNHERLAHNVRLIESNVFLRFAQAQVRMQPRLAAILDLWSLPVEDSQTLPSRSTLDPVGSSA